jgi:hypothetical protein
MAMDTSNSINVNPCFISSTSSRLARPQEQCVMQRGTIRAQ